MNCADAKELLHAYADDELDLVSARQIDAHLQSCPSCGRAFESARAVKTAVSNPALYFRSPASLRERVVATLPVADLQRAVAPPRQLWPKYLSLVASVLLVISVGLLVVQHAGQIDPDAEAVLTSHLRSRQLDDAHLMDVPSTDQHTVKPWLDAKLDFAPPVPQLRDRGFPLIGGRLEYLHDRAVAALVYNHGKHVINVFIWPGESGQSTLSRNGYNLVHWSDAGMTFWAASDVNLADLQKLPELFPLTAGSRNHRFLSIPSRQIRSRPAWSPLPVIRERVRVISLF